jgi:hypothetical protein
MEDSIAHFAFKMFLEAGFTHEQIRDMKNHQGS